MMMRRNLRLLSRALFCAVFMAMPLVAQGADAPVGVTQPDRVTVKIAPDAFKANRSSDGNDPVGTAPRAADDSKTNRVDPAGLPTTLILPTGLPDLTAGIKAGRGAPIYEPGDGAFKPDLRYVDQFASQNSANLRDLTTPRGGHGHQGVGKQLAGAAKAAALNGGIIGAETVLDELLH